MARRPRRHRSGLAGGARLTREPSGGLSVQTLVISSAAAVVATVVVSQFWEPGTVLFTALVPIVVAVTSEVLRRPAEKLTAAAPKVAPIVASRRAADGPSVRDPAPEPPPVRERDDPFGLREPERRSRLDDRRIRLGLVTGLIAFLIGAAFVTLSELTFGGSVGGGDRRTTLLGGSETPQRETEPRDDDEATATPTAGPDPAPAPAEPQATPTAEPSITPTPSASPTVAPRTAPPQATPPAATPQPSPTP